MTTINVDGRLDAIENTLQKLLTMVENINVDINNNLDEYLGYEDENKYLKSKLIKETKSTLTVEKIIKWKEVLGITYRDLRYLTDDQKMKKVGYLADFKHKYFDNDIRQLLIAEILASINPSPPYDPIYKRISEVFGTDLSDDSDDEV